MRATYDDIEVALIQANPNQPRQHFDEDALRELAQSIASEGLLQPIVVRPIEGGGYRIIAGERRWRASALTGITAIPCRVLHDLSDEAAFTLSVIENVVRRDMTAMEEARAYNVLRAGGKSIEDIAAATGKSVRWVTMFLDLLALVPEIQHLLDNGGMKIGVAWSASRCTPDGQRSVLRRYVAGDFASDMDAQAFASAVLAAESQDSLFASEADDPVAVKVKADRKHAMLGKLDRIAVAGYVLSEIAVMEPTDVAELLTGHKGGAAAQRDSLRDVVKQANKALAVLRKAAASSAAQAARAEDKARHTPPITAGTVTSQ